MRTRTSNRHKRFHVKKYDSQSGSDDGDDGPEPAPRRRQNADEWDANFDDDGDGDSDGDSNGDGADGPGASDSAADASQRRPRQRPLKAVQGDAAPRAAAYRDIEPVPPDSHAVKSYVGRYDRVIRGQSLVRMWYGPHRDRINVAQRLLDRWIGWAVLPPKLLPPGDELADKGVWSPGFFDREARLAERWRMRWRPGGASRARAVLTAQEARPYQLPSRPLPVLLGPYPAQREAQFHPGDACALSQASLPLDEDAHGDEVPTGWMLDAGGLVVGMDWAPRQAPQATQVLALAVLPHADHEDYDFEAEHQKPGFQRHGTVQLWGFQGQLLESGILRPSAQRPTLHRTLCLDRGRATRVKWSPCCHHLAVLCGDGAVCIVDVDEQADGAYEKIQEPLASLALADEEGVKATAMAWTSFNRLVTGYSDGSVALWSIHPTRLLSRHPVHHSHVVDIVTGYPSMPYLVASLPVGGSAKLIDLRSPSCETTEVQTNAVNWQPHLLAWSDHIQGFFSVYPSANALNTMVGFMHHRYFPLVRRIFTSECYLSCLSVGRTHPYLLIGTTDGSLWSLNPQCELFRARRPPSDRIRIFQHEHRPAELMSRDQSSAPRGASRIIHGFGPDKNRHFMTEAKPPPRRGKKSNKNDDEADDAAGDDGSASLLEPARGIVYELLTRVTAVEWNPNQGYGCWAAAALGSGLVRVLDLGLENIPADAQR